MSGYFEDFIHVNNKPVVDVIHPLSGAKLRNIVMIRGTASDLDGDDTIVRVEMKIENEEWIMVNGTINWYYEWVGYRYRPGLYNIYTRAFDGEDYSDEKVIEVELLEDMVSNDPDTHKWGLFVIASNFPEDNDSKLGNGGLYLAERMSKYFIDSLNYPLSNIIILFDDGWVRSDNGLGKRIETLQEYGSNHDVTYGSALKSTVIDSLNYIIDESNRYDDSEVFIWVFNHGYGNVNNTLTGGRILKRSIIFLWDGVLSDRDLGTILKPLRSKETCIIVDACYSGGFADKSIYNLPTALLLRSGIPRSGRIVITGSSKFRQGYTNTIEGPLFTLLWFEGLTSGEADGYKPGLLGGGRPTRLRFFRDGKVSVEEAYYYASYKLRTSKEYEDYKKMLPEMNDCYPYKGLFILNRKQMILG
ncbi:MAG: hypothetical protein QXS02_03820 [Candidatus Thermoplasmatota archaeon]